MSIFEDEQKLRDELLDCVLAFKTQKIEALIYAAINYGWCRGYEDAINKSDRYVIRKEHEVNG